MQKEQGFIAVVAAVVLGLLCIAASVFAFWAYGERQSYKNDVDAKIEVAVDNAVAEAESAKETEFTEREKLPTRVFTGPSTFGSLSFEYPKTWSVYVEENTSGTVLDVYVHPDFVPSTDSGSPYAFRAEIVSSTYDEVVANIQQSFERGTLRASAYRPAKVTSALGIKVEGEIERELLGAAVYLPLRDRTIKLYTQSTKYIPDFNNIFLPSLTFAP